MKGIGMFGRSTVYIGLDIGSYAVKAVALLPTKDRMTLMGFSHQRIGESEPAEAIKRALDQLGVKSRQLVTGVSGRSVIVRMVETPRLADQELKNHILYEADKYIPFGTDEVVIDCQPLPEVGEADQNVMDVQLVAVRRGFIDDHVALLNSAGLHPKVIDVDVFALCNAYEVFGPRLQQDIPLSDDTSNDENAPPPVAPVEELPVVALVDIGASKVCVAIVRGHRPLFTREFYLAGNEITDAISRTLNESPEEVEERKLNAGDDLDTIIDAAMPAIEDLANEIRLSFDYVENQYDEEVHSVLLSGGSSQLAGFGDILGNILGKPVQVFDPIGGVDLVSSKYDIPHLDNNAPGLTVALGLASHLAARGLKGLGGPQVVNWQARVGLSSGSMPTLSTIEDTSGTAPLLDDSPEPPPPQEPISFAPEPVAPPPPPPPMEAPAAMAPPPPPPPVQAPVAEALAPPPPISVPGWVDEDGQDASEEAATIAPPAAPAVPANAFEEADQAAAAPAPEGDGSQVFGSDAYYQKGTGSFGKSSMLVILDDDESMDDLASQRIARSDSDVKAPAKAPTLLSKSRL